MIEMAAEAGLLGQVLPKGAKLRCSLYADDAGVFIRADKADLKVLKSILETFEGCSGLKINFDKTEIFPIRYPEVLWPNLLEAFPSKYAKLPGKYLGLPLHFRTVKRIELQPLVEKINKRLAGWKGRLLSKAARETLVKSVLSAQPIYHLTVFPTQKWLLQKIDKIRRSFLWKGSNPESCNGGHCLVNWPTTCLPKSKGGLGILDLDRFARALRLRWMWMRWKAKEKAWVDLQLPCDKTDEDLFNASTCVKVGNGKTAVFWKSSWIHGQAPKNIAPSLFKKAKKEEHFDFPCPEKQPLDPVMLSLQWCRRNQGFGLPLAGYQ
jgi:hypothetical protein